MAFSRLLVLRPQTRRGNRRTQTVLALARRRVNVLWALLRDDRPYQPAPPLTTAA